MIEPHHKLPTVRQSSILILAGVLSCWASPCSGQDDARPTRGEETESNRVEPLSPASQDARQKNSLPAKRKVRLIANLQYCKPNGKAGACDLYLPNVGPPESGFPVVMIVHGGGWVSGDKWTVEGYGRVLAGAGFAAITINYRLAPTFKFPAPLDDVRQALVWTKQNAKRYSFDQNRIGMFGYSAGGHLCLLTALLSGRDYERLEHTTDWKEKDPRWSLLPKISAVCAGGPPCDFRALPPDNLAYSFFLGGSRRDRPETYVAASPLAHVWQGAPPVQLIHGNRDLIVPISASQCMMDALDKVGVQVKMETIENQGHMLTFLNSKTSSTMLEFFQQTIGNQPNPTKSITP